MNSLQYLINFSLLNDGCNQWDIVHFLAKILIKNGIGAIDCYIVYRDASLVALCL